MNAPQRVGAGLVYTASIATNQGHVAERRETLISAASQLLGVPLLACEVQLGQLLEKKELIADGEGAQIYFPPFYYAEVGIANKLHILLASPFSRLAFYRQVNWRAVLTWLDEHNAFQLSRRQKEAVYFALTKQVVILTGGPGTGKSTVTGTIIKLLKAKRKSFLLAAPTGRAVKRLNETTGEPALTIHRLLEWKPGGFLRNNEKPLDADLIIIDEASMIDTLLMNSLLKAIDPGTHLLLVGDVDQLPSVGAGNVLRDLIASRKVPTVVLDTIYRQAADSVI